MSTPSIDWSKQATLFFIETWREYPCLWQVKNKQYKNIAFRERALNELKNRMTDVIHNINVDDIKRKINTLRSQYRREMNLMKASKNSGAGVDEVYVPKLWSYSYLEFLNETDSQKESRTNLCEDEEVGEDIIQMAGEEDISIASGTSIMEKIDHSYDPSPTNSNISITSTRPSRSGPSIKQKNDDPADTLLKLAINKMSERTEKNVTEVYANYLAMEIEKLDEKYIPIVKKLISDVFFLAQVERLKDTAKIDNSE